MTVLALKPSADVIARGAGVTDGMVSEMAGERSKAAAYGWVRGARHLLNLSEGCRTPNPGSTLWAIDLRLGGQGALREPRTVGRCQVEKMTLQFRTGRVDCPADGAPGLVDLPQESSALLKMATALRLPRYLAARMAYLSNSAKASIAGASELGIMRPWMLLRYWLSPTN